MNFIHVVVFGGAVWARDYGKVRGTGSILRKMNSAAADTFCILSHRPTSECVSIRHNGFRAHRSFFPMFPIIGFGNSWTKIIPLNSFPCNPIWYIYFSGKLTSPVRICIARFMLNNEFNTLFREFRQINGNTHWTRTSFGSDRFIGIGCICYAHTFAGAAISIKWSNVCVCWDRFQVSIFHSICCSI